MAREILQAAHARGHVVLACFVGGTFEGFRVCADPRQGDSDMIEIGRYRMRGVEAGGDVTSKGGFDFVEVMCEITQQGPHAAMRVKFRGYLHTEREAKRTIEALRVLGWKGKTRTDLEALRGGNLHGIGSCEVIGSVQHDAGIGRNGKPGRFPRVAFINAIPTVSGKTAAPIAAAFDLDKMIGGELDEEDDAQEAPANYDPATGEVRGDDFPAEARGSANGATAHAAS
jgi:hypothetical protein